MYWDRDAEQVQLHFEEFTLVQPMRQNTIRVRLHIRVIWPAATAVRVQLLAAGRMPAAAGAAG